MSEIIISDELSEKFKILSADLEIFWYDSVKEKYLKEFKNLPCGKSERVRMNRKRRRIIMNWYDKNHNFLGERIKND